VPVAVCGWDHVEVRRGQLLPLEDWPLLHHAADAGGAVHAADAQVDRDLPPEVASALGVRSVDATPLLAADDCLGFVFVDQGGVSFEATLDGLALLTAAAAISATLAPILGSRRAGASAT